MKKLFGICLIGLLGMFLCAPVSADWVVTWEVMALEMVSCSTSKPMPDEFGRIAPMSVTTLPACYDTRIEYLNKSFSSKADAEAFIKRGQADAKKEWENSLQNFKLSEVK